MPETQNRRGVFSSFAPAKYLLFFANFGQIEILGR
jgi:hypothetical protein